MQEYYVFISIFQVFALKFGYFDLIRELIYDARKTKMDDRGYVMLAQYTLEVGKFLDLGRFFGGWNIGTARKYVSANWTAAALFSAIYAGAHFDDYKAAISAVWSH